MSFMIWRTEKLKTRSAISAAAGHMMRTRPTPNANPKIKNRILMGSAAPAKDVFDKLDTVEKIRKNAVLAIDFLATGSPEWWETASANDKNEWVSRLKAEICREFGEENIIHMNLHMDEKTPHLTGLIVPLDGGKLRASKWLDGPDKMSKRQDRMAEVVKDLGLKRGIKGSKAKHQRVKRFYGLLAQEAETAEQLDELTRFDLLNKSKIEEHNARVREFNAVLKEARDLRAHGQLQADQIKRKDQANQAAQDRADRIEAQRDKAEAKQRITEDAYKAQTDQLRNMPLTEVAQRLGLERDKDQNWKDEARTVAISFDGRKFYDHKAQSGGGGAFDLVKHCMECDFQTAKAWMLSNFGVDAFIAERVADTYKQAKAEAKQLEHCVQNNTQKTYQPPEPVQANWNAVRRYLTRGRELAESIIDGMHERGEIYADRFRNVVFKGPAGAILRGTNPLKPFKGHAKGSDRKKGWRGLVGPQETFDQCLVISENPIDAISYMQGNDLHGTAASTGGVTDTMPENLRHQAWRKIIVAFDNDAEGKKFGARLVKDIKDRGFKDVEARYPRHLKDWNEHLIQYLQQQRKEQKKLPKPRTPK